MVNYNGSSIYNDNVGGGLPPGEEIIEGVVYKTVEIGGMVWTAENLDLVFPTMLLNQAGYSSEDRRGNYYNNDQVTYGRTGKRYGILYNFGAVSYMQANRDSFFPGWHIPTKEEWEALILAAGGTDIAGEHLKNETGWDGMGNGDNIFGFSALPAGDYDGNFYDDGSSAYFWTATPRSTFNAYHALLKGGSYTDAVIGEQQKGYQYSIRLVKDP